MSLKCLYLRKFFSFWNFSHFESKSDCNLIQMRRGGARLNGRREGGGGRSRNGDQPGQVQTLSPELLRSLLTSPGLPPALAPLLLALEEKERQGDIGRGVLAELGVVEILMDSLN